MSLVYKVCTLLFISEVSCVQAYIMCGNVFFRGFLVVACFFEKRVTDI